MSDRAAATAFAVAEHLQQLLAGRTLAPDVAEGVEVALQCVSEAFGVDLASEEHATKYSLRARGLQLDELVASALASAPAAASPATSASASAAAPKPDVAALAESLKSEGNAHLKDGLYESAIDAYTRAIRATDGESGLSAARAVYFANRAAAHLCVKNVEDAAADCEQAIALDPSYAKAYGRLGLCRTRLGQHDRAVQAYRKAVELDPSNDKLRSDLKQAEEKLTGGSGDAAPALARAATTPSQPAAGAAANPFAGLGDLGGALGGMGGMGGLGSLLQNPAMLNLASQMMQSGAFNDMLNNPAIAQMAQNMMAGGYNGPPDSQAGNGAPA